MTKAKPRRPSTVSVYMQERLVKQIEQLAKSERRSLSQMASVLLSEALQKRIEMATK